MLTLLMAGEVEHLRVDGNEKRDDGDAPSEAAVRIPLYARVQGWPRASYRPGQQFRTTICENRKEQPMPGKEKPFQKGQSGNPGGRPKVLGDVQELARQRSPEAINTLVKIMQNEKAPPAARVVAANSLLDRGYGKPTQPISQTLTKIDPSTMSDAELTTIVRNGMQADDRPH